LREVVADPDSEIDVGEILAAESSQQDGDDYELSQNDAV
jgi:hypothetical protein